MSEPGTHRLLVASALSALLLGGAAALSGDSTVAAGKDTGPAISEAGEYVYLVPASAHAEGLEGTSWVSDVVLHNPGEEPAMASIFFLEREHDNSSVRGIWVAVPTCQSVKLGDIVAETFGESSATGALLVGSDEELVVSSRTYNDADTGTFGQFVPAMPVLEAIGTGVQARLIQLTRTDDYRTNIGFASASGESLEIQVKLHRANGSSLGTQVYTLAPYSYLQKTDIFGTDVSDAYAVVSSPSQSARYFTYASVVDNASGDPVMVLPGYVSSGLPMYVPAAAHVAGVGGTNWRTDLEVNNPGTAQMSFKVELLKKGENNVAPLSRVFSLLGGHSTRYEDILHDVFLFSGSGALRVTPLAGALHATTRTYNLLESGTYGQFIPSVPKSSAIDYGEEGILVQLSRSASVGVGYRTNIGFTSVSSATIAVRVELYQGDGTPLGTKYYSLLPFGHDQVTDIFAQVTSSDVEDGYAIVATTTAGGEFFSYASVVDNSSGDPVYIPAVVLGDDLAPPPPAFPPMLTAEPASSSWISLSWTQVAGAISYHLRRGETTLYEGSGMTHMDIGLTGSTTYCYAVNARNASGESPFSPEVCATTDGPAPTEAPDLTITETTSTTVSLSWTAVSAATRYRLKRGATVVYEGNARSFTDTGLEPGTQICYLVKGVNDVGGGPFSTEVCAVTEAAPAGTGVVWAWGRDDQGQLGDGEGGGGYDFVWRPVEVEGPADVKAVAGSSSGSLTVTWNGHVWQWGHLGTTSQVPVELLGYVGVKTVAAGSDFGLMIRADGSLWAWGGNESGQLGDGTTADRTTPGPVYGLSSAATAAGGHGFALAARADGTLRAWGRNDRGQLGDGTTAEQHIAVEIDGLLGVSSVACGHDHSVAVAGDGTVWAWGANDLGQLGSGATVDRSEPAQVPGLASIVAVASGADHTLALRDDGTVWAWGWNDYGQLGFSGDQEAPQQVPGLSGVTAIACGDSHSLAITDDGTAWAWGRNDVGQLGDATRTSRFTPQPVLDITGVVAIAGGGLHSLAVAPK